MTTLLYDANFSDEEILDFFNAEGIDLDGDTLTLKNITFPTRDDALEYLEDMVQLYSAISIRYSEPLDDFEKSEIYQSLVDKLNSSIKSYLDFPESMLVKLSEQKSKLKACPTCDSKINIESFVDNSSKRLLNIIETAQEQKLGLEDFLEFKSKSISCPICDDTQFVVGATDEIKLKSLRNKIYDSEKKLKEEEMSFKIKSGQKIVGLIGFREVEL